MRFVTASRFVAVVLCSLILASCVQPGEPRSTSERRGGPTYASWPHQESDIRPDPAVRMGVLANGMRFAIMRNAQPAGTISLRLRIASGSLQESDAQRGLAHFMEHMAFNGSKNVPEGEFVKLLQRKGLAFGAHTNAYTSTDETVYTLELPKNDADLTDTGLMLFREIGDRLTLDPAAIEREKGVVLSEQRTRNTPEYRAFEDQWALLYEGQRQAQRLPIGTAETIKGATAELLGDYYRRFYRPERTMLVVTGDMDPAEIEAKVRAKFEDWRAQGADPADPEQGPLKKRGLVAASHVEANMPENVSITWLAAPEDVPDSVAVRALNLRRQIGLSILSRRLARIARDANPPFVGAGVGLNNARGLSRSLSLTLSARPGEWARGLAAAEQSLRRAMEFGFSEAEVSRELKEWRAALEDAVTKADTRQTSDLADQIISSFGDRKVFSAPGDQLARFERAAQTVTPESVLTALRDVRGGEGPIVFVSTSKAIAGGNGAVAAAFEGSVKTAVAPALQLDAKSFPYASFGTPGRVAERREAADLGVTMVRFANGVMLNLKPTNFEKDSIYVTARFAGGSIHMPPGKIGLNWVLPFAFIEGGLKRLTTDELEESTAGRIVSNSLSMDEEAFELSGRTNARDLELQMRLLAAYATDAAYRTSGLERIQAAAENYIKQFSSSPGRVISREAPALLRSGDARWAFPSVGNMRSITIRDVEGTLAPALATAPLEITVVGDFSVDTVIASVGETFAALPARAAKLPERVGARDVKFPQGNQALRFTHEGRADQASAYVAWAAPDFYSDPRRARAISVLREVLEVRLIDEFREAQGATYSPSVGGWNSGALPNFGYITASAETRPELVDGFFATLDKIVEELRSGSFSDDVLARARTPIVKSVETSRLTNSYWLGAIEDVQSEPRALATIRSQLSDLQGISKADVVAAAKAYLGRARRIEVRVLPSAGANSTKGSRVAVKQP